MLLCSYFLARAFHQLWLQQGNARVPVKLYRAVSGVRLRDIVREVRQTF